jgi:hypothetical protein
MIRRRATVSAPSLGRDSYLRSIKLAWSKVNPGGATKPTIRQLKLFMPIAKLDLAGSTRITINGNNGWLLGANLPWINCGNDFGENAYGSYGIGSPNPPKQSAPLSSDELRTAFYAMQASGVNVARWFLFVDGRAGITYDAAAGSPTGLDEVIFRDIDAAIATAAAHGIKIMFVLISFDWMFEEAQDQVSGGKSYILQSPTLQDELVRNVFVPLFQRYANNDSVIAYDVANEPEWALTMDGNPPNPLQINGRLLDPVSLEDFTRFVTQVTTAARQHALAQYVTLGSARAKWVGYWQNVGLDFYQFHYYPATEGDRTLDEVLPDLPPDLNRPIWLGEIPANVTGSVGFMTNALEVAYTARLAGAAPWSMRGVDEYGAADPAALKQFCLAHSPDINSGVPPGNAPD